MSHISSNSQADDYLHYNFGDDFLNINTEEIASLTSTAADASQKDSSKGLFETHHIQAASPSPLFLEEEERLSSGENFPKNFSECNDLYHAAIISEDESDDLEPFVPIITSKTIFEATPSLEPVTSSLGMEEGLSKATSSSTLSSTLNSEVTFDSSQSTSGTNIAGTSSRKRKVEELTPKERALFDNQLVSIEQKAKETYEQFSYNPKHAKKETEKIVSQLFNKTEIKKQFNTLQVDIKPLIKATIRQALPSNPEIQKIEKQARTDFAEAIKSGFDQDTALLLVAKNALKKVSYDKNKMLKEEVAQVKNKIYFAIRACNVGTLDNPALISNGKASQIAAEVMNQGVS